MSDETEVPAEPAGKGKKKVEAKPVKPKVQKRAYAAEFRILERKLDTVRRFLKRAANATPEMAKELLAIALEELGEEA